MARGRGRNGRGASPWVAAWTLALAVTAGLAQPAKPPANGNPAPPATNGAAPATGTTTPPPPAANGATPAPLPPPPGDAHAATEPNSGKAKPAPTRRKAYIYVLDPNSIVKTKGPDNSVVARGKLQMVLPEDEVILFCNAVDYSGEKTGIATLTGDLKIITGKLVKQNGLDVIPKPENTITGDIGYVFTKEKRAVIDGQVVVVHTPKEPAPAGANEATQARHDQTTLYCDRLTYWYRAGDRKGVAQPRLPNTSIRFVQAKRRGTAGQATYYQFDQEQNPLGDVVDLVGGVHGEDDNGQLIEAEVARLYPDSDSSNWYNVQRVVVNLEEEQPNPNEPAGPPANPATGAATPAPAAPPTASGTAPAIPAPGGTAPAAGGATTTAPGTGTTPPAAGTGTAPAATPPATGTGTATAPPTQPERANEQPPPVPAQTPTDQPPAKQPNVGAGNAGGPITP